MKKKSSGKNQPVLQQPAKVASDAFYLTLRVLLAYVRPQIGLAKETAQNLRTK